MTKAKWTGFPEPSEEQIERSVVSAITGIMDLKKVNDRCDARWFVGTSPDDKSGRLAELLMHGGNVVMAISVWERTTVARAAGEIAKYHGMALDGDLRDTDMYVYAFTDREPTMEERRQRAREVLTVKQKRVFSAIWKHVRLNGKAPTQAQLMRSMGHRSASTTKGYLEILEKKNWIVAPRQGQRLEII